MQTSIYKKLSKKEIQRTIKNYVPTIIFKPKKLGKYCKNFLEEHRAKTELDLNGMLEKCKHRT